MDTSPQTAPTPRTPEIDGVGLRNLAWVRVTGGEDLRETPGGTRSLSVRSSDDALHSLGAWAASDGHDTARIKLNLRNSLHGSLNHVVADSSFGTWSNKGTVIVAPLDALIKANGPPATLGTVDTWWTLAADQNLRLAGETLIRAERAGGPTVPLDALSFREGSTVTYATTLNEPRERAILGAMNEYDRRELVQNVASAMGNERDAVRAQLALPRAARDPEAARVIDAHLIPEGKRIATEAVIREIGPVRPGGNWAWSGIGAGNDDTAKMAAVIGSKTGSHGGGPEDLAVDLMEAGKAKTVLAMEGISPGTAKFAASLDADPRYEAFAKARAVDGELGNAVRVGATTLSADAAERLVVMVERAARGEPVPAISVTTIGMNAKTRFSPHLDTDRVSEDTIERAIRENLTMGRLLKTAASSVGAESPLADRIDHARAAVGQGREALQARIDETVAHYERLGFPPPPPDEGVRPPTAVVYERQAVVSRVAAMQPALEQVPVFEGATANAAGRSSSIMLAVMDLLRTPEPATPGPWDRKLTPMGERIAAYTAGLSAAGEESRIKGAEVTATATVTSPKSTPRDNSPSPSP